MICLSKMGCRYFFIYLNINNRIILCFSIIHYSERACLLMKFVRHVYSRIKRFNANFTRPSLFSAQYRYTFPSILRSIAAKLFYRTTLIAAATFYIQRRTLLHLKKKEVMKLPGNFGYMCERDPLDR